MKKLLTQEELSEELRVDPVLLFNLRKMGMPYIRLCKKLFRYDYDDVIDWLHDYSDMERTTSIGIRYE